MEGRASHSIWDNRHTTLGRPLIIAHRGGTHTAPENTRAAFEAALAAGADVIETDLHLTRDGIAICLHDTHLRHSLRGETTIADLTYDEILAVKPDVPAFDELSGLHTAVFLDLKEARPDRQIALLEAIDARHRGGDWIVGIGNLELAKTVGRAFPALTQVSLMSDRRDISGFRHGGGCWARVHERFASPDLLLSLRGEGLGIVITCGGNGRDVGEISPRELEQVARLVPDAIVVNDPAMAVRFFAG